MANAILIPQFEPDLSGFALKEHTHSQYLTEHQSLTNYATKTYVANQIAAIDFPDAGVLTFNGRAGAVEPKNGDYTADMIGAAPKSHTHSQYLTSADLKSSEDLVETIRSTVYSIGSIEMHQITVESVKNTKVDGESSIKLLGEKYFYIIRSYTGTAQYSTEKDVVGVITRGSSFRVGGANGNYGTTYLLLQVSFSEDGFLSAGAYLPQNTTTGVAPNSRPIYLIPMGSN